MTRGLITEGVAEPLANPRRTTDEYSRCRAAMQES